MNSRQAAAQVTASSRSNFCFAFLLMRKERRSAIYAVYAYCRLIDDIVDSDDPVEQKQAALAVWEAELQAAFQGGSPQHPVALALREAHQVRRDACLLARPHRAGPAVAGEDLVGMPAGRSYTTTATTSRRRWA